MNSPYAQLKQIWQRLTLGQRLSLAVGAFLTLALIGGLVNYSSQTEFGILFTDLRPVDAQTMVEKLKGANVPYRLSNNGSTIAVPQEKVSELRLQMAAAGVLSGGHVGFDLFDKTSLGVTDFTQQVNYQRALEGELAKTLEGMSEVQAARVHITRSRDSLFTEKAEPAKASVLLNLRKMQLAEERTEAIVSLVASAVEGLSPENITVTDARGNLLAGEGAASLKAGHKLDNLLEIRRKFETETAERIVTLLEPITGVNHVRANVTADLDFSQVEQTEEMYDPKSAVKRMEQVTSESKSLPPGLGGVVGTKANDPVQPAPAVTPVETPPSEGKSSSTSTFEIDKTNRHTVKDPSGKITKLSVSVLLDTKTEDPKPTARTPEEVAQIHDLVAAAVGIDPNRGDRIEVRMLPFSGRRQETAPLPWYQQNRELTQLAIKYGTLGLVALVLILVILRPVYQTLRTAAVPPAPEPRLLPAPEALALPAGETAPATPALRNSLLQEMTPPRTVAELEATIEPEPGEHPVPEPVKIAKVPLTLVEDKQFNEIRDQLIGLCKEKPEAVALSIRNWLQEPEPK